MPGQAPCDQKAPSNELPKDPPVNEHNALAKQTVEFYEYEDCNGTSSAKFDSSANAFLRDFSPYVKKMVSVKLCGKGTFFYFATPDMQMLSTLGHVTRCGETISTSLEDCDCENLKPETRCLVESFTLQYC